MRFGEWEGDLQAIASEVGARVKVGAPPQGNVLGAPPADAHTHRLADGSIVVSGSALGRPSDFEQVLHELAHLHLGMRETYDEEAACYRWAAVQALRLPVEVSTCVAEMAKEALS
jgi:hypothetical protein